MAAKTSFKLPYAGIADPGDGPTILYGARGEFSMVMAITNTVCQYAASGAAYDDFHSLMVSLVGLLGEGHIVQKLDIFTRQSYAARQASDYLQRQYEQHFEGRSYTQIRTYLVITRTVSHSAFYVYDKKMLQEFTRSAAKALQLLEAGRAAPRLLDQGELQRLIGHMLSMNFDGDHLFMDNLCAGDTELTIGEQAVRSITLVNTDEIILPAQVGTHALWNEKETLKGFPVDQFSFLAKVPGAQTVIYSQVIEIPPQVATLKKLELKKKRHSGIPDPANLLCVKDIDELLTDVARDSQLLVNCHFNILVAAAREGIARAANFIEHSLFSLGIVPARNACNQLELFRSALPGNAVELKSYDWFLTTCPAALCLLFKESPLGDESSDFLIRFTDRQGVPIAMDPADLPMRTGRIGNRNKFVLGPSGSGKSFFMNALLEQYMLYNMDMVVVDTGHSYSGLCRYYGGKYITYTDSQPITMNPFAISAQEYNIEKKDFLVTLVCLLWKGASGTVSAVERDVISHTLGAYFDERFSGAGNSELSFNSFYEFALTSIPHTKAQEHIAFDTDEFRYVLKKFYRGGEYQHILNEKADESLFTERFIVFEIDAIKEHRILFPIVTLVIMDVFIQKMRYRSDRRKCLVVEEAWKAIASPLMAAYLLYLYKTVRKFWGEAIVVTQELGDILGNEVVKDSIISNSDTICLLDQTKFRDNYQEIAALLSISEVERRKIFTIGQLDNRAGRSMFKEVYIRRGSLGEVYGVEVSIHQYLTYTTEKPEKSAVEVYLRHYECYPQAIDAFVRELGGSGLPLGEFVTRVNRRGQPYGSPPGVQAQPAEIN